MYKTIEKHTTKCKTYILIVRGDFNAELGSGHGTGCASVGKHTRNEGNKRGGFTALNTMYRKTFEKQTTYRSPKGNEKQIDCMLTKRRYLKYNKDAEANDRIHMGSDHRCVMATFTIITPEKSSHCKSKNETTGQ